MFCGICFENADPKSYLAVINFQPHGIFQYLLSFVNNFPYEVRFFIESGEKSPLGPI